MRLRYQLIILNPIINSFVKVTREGTSVVGRLSFPKILTLRATPLKCAVECVFFLIVPMYSMIVVLR